ncbi:MAG: biotin transporter BioY [Oscillospiraceae bacterium]|nr:biotin transporter BioY [Oscillospiraceae bacterium]MDE5885673.1 biotin transporter BioY [Oscillospiraceae bacterium]
MAKSLIQPGQSEGNPNTGRLFTTRELVFTGICSALLAVCSWISIPTVVPFTFQTFGVFCTLELLGGKKGFFSILVFLLLGAVGIPVFAEFSSGLGVLLGTTGGYLIGFLFTAGIYWLVEKIPLHQTIWFRVIVLIVGLAVCYLFGTLWFMQVYARNVEAISFGTALKACVIPFLIPDAVKLALAMILTGRIKKYVSF